MKDYEKTIFFYKFKVPKEHFKRGLVLKIFKHKHEFRDTLVTSLI